MLLLLPLLLPLLAAPCPALQDTFEPLRQGDAPEHAYLVPFAPDGDHDPDLPTPDELLGQPVGSRLARPEEIVAAFTAWAELSPRMELLEYGRTYEDRPLVVALIGSPRNLARRDELRAALARLDDPRGQEGLDELLDDLPAVAWMGYSIHGDETSGADAALAFAHHLVANRGEEHERLLEQVLVVLDPCMNPDGRARFAAQLTSRTGYVPSLDPDSLHRGGWPHGRTNHYLFDMNRDWMVGVAPETRGRWSVLRDWPPQLFVDAHEMGALDTFLFYPQADPRNPALPGDVFDWQSRFARDAADEFDRQGWGYYTREWADAWGPMYSDSWGSLGGAVGILYEQKRLGGQALRRESGEVVSYREAVHGQFVASLANLRTLAANRRALLERFLRLRRESVDPAREGALRAFVVRPAADPERAALLVERLRAQGIEVWSAREPVAVREALHSLGGRDERLDLPAGSYLVPSAQPRSRMVHAYLDFDPRIDAETLLEERQRLERDGDTKMYDVTAWDLGRSFGLDALWCTLERLPREDGRWSRVAEPASFPTGLAAPAAGPAYAYVVDGEPDSSVRFAGRALLEGLAVHLADEPFTAAGRTHPRGSLLVRRHENEDRLPDWEQRVERAARAAGALAAGVTTGLSPDEGPDLGGGHFQLLRRPRIALLGGGLVSSYDQGHAWQLLDEELRLPVSVLEAEWLAQHDLRRFDVLVVPPVHFGFVLENARDQLATWVEQGGTLIAFGGAAADIAAGALEVSTVRRRDALEELEAYAVAARRELAARAPVVDLVDLWEGPRDPLDAGDGPRTDGGEDGGPAPDPERPDPDPEREDAWARRFAPAGVIARALVDPEHWITAGLPEELPVLVQGSTVLLSRSPVETPLRLAEEQRLRLGGLLWPEARRRLAHGAWLTVERIGDGQVVLMAASPVFRGWYRGTARLFANAVVYGPGAGARAPLTSR